MMKAKLKEINLHHTTRETDLNNNNIHPNRTIEYHNRAIPHMNRRDLPELKLIKKKMKGLSETENERKNENVKPPRIKQNKSYSQCKQSNIVLPQIKGKKTKSEVKPLHNINTFNINKLKPAIPNNKYKGNKTIIKHEQSTLKNNMANDTDLNMDDLDLMAKRIQIISSLYNSLSLLSTGNNTNNIGTTEIPSLWNTTKPKVTKITYEIMGQSFKSFESSIQSHSDEFKHDDYAKGYAYNTNQGNVRDYNEDTITARKIGSFHFFGVYDGHGGNGCSIYLRDHLHHFIKEFSMKGIKDAINEAENTFIKNHGYNKEGELNDSSGSCGIMAMIQGNQCIIANVGDSRCVVFRNHKVDFYTEDHKPGSDIEKERITKAGGKIYQTPSFFPLFQNGEEVQIPWRVFPGRLSVSRTFGDIEAKEEKLGGAKNVVVALPDVTHITLTREHNFIVLGCDGIFDVMSNEELQECINIVIKETRDHDINTICGEAANMIIKAALTKDSFDNVSCIVIALSIR